MGLVLLLSLRVQAAESSGARTEREARSFGFSVVLLCCCLLSYMRKARILETDFFLHLVRLASGSWCVVSEYNHS